MRSAICAAVCSVICCWPSQTAVMSAAVCCCPLVTTLSYELINCSCESNLRFHYCSHDIAPYWGLPCPAHKCQLRMECVLRCLDCSHSVGHLRFFQVTLNVKCVFKKITCLYLENKIRATIPLTTIRIFGICCTRNIDSDDGWRHT